MLTGCWYLIFREVRRAARTYLPIRVLILIVGLGISPDFALANSIAVSGTISDPAGRPVATATVDLVGSDRNVLARISTGPAGLFQLSAESPGNYLLIVTAAGFQTASKTLVIDQDGPVGEVNVSLRISTMELVRVTADVGQVDLYSPDPAETVFVRQDLIDANPGRPGAPVSIPGFPVETASGGIKASQ